MKYVLMMVACAMLLVSCKTKTEPVAERWEMPVQEVITTFEDLVDTIAVSPITATSPVVRDLTPAAYTLQSAPLLNYTGGSSISTPKFRVNSEKVQFVEIVNPCYETGLAEKTMDIGLSLAYNSKGIYGLEVFSGGQPKLLYRKPAMGGAVAAIDSALFYMGGGYGVICAVKCHPEDGPKLLVKVTELQKPDFFVAQRLTSYQKDSRGRIVGQIVTLTGYQGAHCIIYTRGA